MDYTPPRNIRAILGVAILFLAACSPVPTPTPSPTLAPAQPTASSTSTRIPPTATSAPLTSTTQPSTPAPTPTATRISNEAPPVAITLILNPNSPAGQTPSTATFTTRSSKTEIVLNIQPSTPGIAQPAGLLEGGCDRPGITRYALTTIADGKSVTTIDLPITTMLSGAMILDIKKSTRESNASALCAPVPDTIFYALGPGANGNQSGVAVAFPQAGGTEVDVFIKPGPPGIPQPAFIREGNCLGLGGIRYSLNQIVDGASKTFYGVPFNIFRKENGALNIHRSIQDLDASVACGAIKPPDSDSGDRS